MIFFSIGLPSRFAEVCDALIARLALKSLGAAEAISANTLDELAIAVIRTRCTNLVIGSRQPVTALSHAVTEAGSRFIVALDDPRFALYDLVSRQGVEFLEAVRMVARSCASMVSVAATSGALVLRAERDWGRRLAMAIAQHFEFALGEADLAVAVDTLPPTLPSGDGGYDRWWDGLEELQRAIAAGALDAYVAFFAGNDLGAITWERELFCLGEEENDNHGPIPANRPIDITGRSRFLIYGPYLALPPGSWSVNLALGFSPEAADMSYVIEVGAAATRLAATTIDPRGARTVEVDLVFTVDQSVGAPLEVRVCNERAAFDGRLALGYVTISPRGRIRGDALQFFAAALAKPKVPAGEGVSD